MQFILVMTSALLHTTIVSFKYKIVGNLQWFHKVTRYTTGNTKPSLQTTYILTILRPRVQPICYHGGHKRKHM